MEKFIKTNTDANMWGEMLLKHLKARKKFVLILIGTVTVFEMSRIKNNNNNSHLFHRKYSMSQTPFLGPSLPVLQEEKNSLFKTVPGFKAELT